MVARKKPKKKIKKKKRKKQPVIASPSNYVSVRDRALTEVQELIMENNLVWIFASPRSGTTWLSKLLSYQTKVMDEPYIGYHLASIGTLSGNPEINKYHNKRSTYFFSHKYEEIWKYFLRKLIVNRIYFQFQDNVRKIIIKEPNGSHGSDIIVNCLPLSKIIILIRDGRDVLDSALDVRKEDSWLPKFRSDPLSPENKIQTLSDLAIRWKSRTNLLLSVYENHAKNLRLKIKYEDLRKNTYSELQKIYKFIGIDIPDSKIKELVKKHQFEKIPQEKRGSGKSTRFASPGRWKENFSDEEKRVVEELIGDTLKKLGYE